MAKKFVRTDSTRFSRLGRRRKKLQVWRKAKGRHNKIREKRFSYPKAPAIGYKKPSKDSGKIDGKNVVIVRNLKDLQNVGKESSVVMGSIGARKKLEIAKKASEMKIRIVNLREDKKR